MTLVLAYFIKYCRMSYEGAYEKVKARRKIICPNEGFITQLKQWERQQSHPGRGHSPSPQRPSYSHYSSLSLSPQKSRVSAIEEKIGQLKDFRKSLVVSPTRNPETALLFEKEYRTGAYSPSKIERSSF